MLFILLQVRSVVLDPEHIPICVHHTETGCASGVSRNLKSVSPNSSTCNVSWVTVMPIVHSIYQISLTQLLLRNTKGSGFSLLKNLQFILSITVLNFLEFLLCPILIVIFFVIYHRDICNANIDVDIPLYMYL